MFDDEVLTLASNFELSLLPHAETNKMLAVPTMMTSINVRIRDFIPLTSCKTRAQRIQYKNRKDAGKAVELLYIFIIPKKN